MNSEELKAYVLAVENHERAMDRAAELEREVERLREALEHCSGVMKDPWKHGDGCISRAIDMADAAIAASTAQHDRIMAQAVAKA